MPPVVALSPPDAQDIDELAERMRDQDIAELHAAGFDDPRRVLADSVAESVWSHAVRVNGELACIMGLSLHGTILTAVGVPWMLGTPLVRVQRRPLVRLGRQYIARMLDQAPRLMNVVHADNSVSIRWLKRMGFILHPPQQVGPRGGWFHLFEMRKGGTRNL